MKKIHSNQADEYLTFVASLRKLPETENYLKCLLAFNNNSVIICKHHIQLLIAKYGKTHYPEILETFCLIDDCVQRTGEMDENTENILCNWFRTIAFDCKRRQFCGAMNLLRCVVREESLVQKFLFTKHQEACKSSGFNRYFFLKRKTTLLHFYLRNSWGEGGHFQ